MKWMLCQQGFEIERHVFEKLGPELADRYGDVFVAVHQGAVVDSDPDLQTIVGRFFERQDKASVYFGYVEKRQPVRRVSSPSVQR